MYPLVRSPMLKVLDIGREWLAKGRIDLVRECLKMARHMQMCMGYDLMTDTVTVHPYYKRVRGGWLAATRYDHSVRRESWIVEVFPRVYGKRQSAQRAAKAYLGCNA